MQKLKVEGEQMEEALRVRVMRALACRPLLTFGENVGDFFTLPTIVVDESA